MSDRIYLRTNFSSATAPAASGGRQVNSVGDEYARIPLQLPTNIIDQSKKPERIEMLLTKMSIPLGRVPIAQIPFDDLSIFPGITPLPPLTPVLPRTEIVTQAIGTLWPFTLDRKGNVVPTSYANTQFFNSSGSNSWPIHKFIFPLSKIRGSAAFTEEIREMYNSKTIPIHTPEELMGFLEDGYTKAFHDIIQHYWPINPLQRERPKFRFTIKNSRLQIEMDTGGMLTQFIPYTKELFYFNERGTMLWYNGNPYTTFAYNEGEFVTNQITSLRGFSLVANQVLRDLLPGLPWIKVDNRSLPQHVLDTGEGQSLFHWDEVSPNDPYFYVLDTWDINLTWSEMRTYPPTSELGSTLTYVEAKSPIFTFDSLNMISVVPITSFVVMLNGLTFTPQTYPININPLNPDAAQITSIPIIEVYQPLWNDISDITTNMVISKDAFTNAAPFVLTPDSLGERNLIFEVYYITTDGGMHLLTIPAGTAITLQICYSIVY